MVSNLFALNEKTKRQQIKTTNVGYPFQMKNFLSLFNEKLKDVRGNTNRKEVVYNGKDAIVWIFTQRSSYVITFILTNMKIPPAVQTTIILLHSLIKITGNLKYENYASFYLIHS